MDNEALQKISRQLEQLNKEVDYINRVTKELINVVNGTIGIDGLVQRIKTAETDLKHKHIKDNETLQRFLEDNNAFKIFVMQHLDGIEGNLDDKFEALGRDIESRFENINKFTMEMSEFRKRLESYLALATGKTTWKLLARIAIALIAAGAVLFGIFKGNLSELLKIIGEFLQ